MKLDKENSTTVFKSACGNAWEWGQILGDTSVKCQTNVNVCDSESPLMQAFVLWTQQQISKEEKERT